MRALRSGARARGVGAHTSNTTYARRLAGYFGTMTRVDDETRAAIARALTAAERLQILDEWSFRDIPFPQATVHALFEEQAARTPEAVAAVRAGRALSFRELDERANHLAAFLRGLGVGPDVRVGLCADPSAELPAAHAKASG